MVELLRHFQRALWKSLAHDTFTTAKAAAYSGILALFPALLVLTALLAISPDSETVTGEIRAAMSQVLPPDTLFLVQGYFQTQHASSVRVVWSAGIVSVLAAMGVMLSFMEGFRRAYLIPRNHWGFWRIRLVALVLIPICVVPMIFATVLVAFGHQIENWMVENADHQLRTYVLFIWRLVRWAIALTSGVAVVATIYHFGTPRTQHWKRIVPGAAMATGMWFLATLLYGWYVTRFAQYTLVYGSLAASIATLVWLYITSFSVLIGAEFNAQLYPKQLPMGNRT